MDIPILPDTSSFFAQDYDWLMLFVVALSVFFAVLVAVLVLYFAVKYRRGTRVDRSKPVHHHQPLEMATITFLLFLSLVTFAWSAKLYTDAYNPPDSAMQIFVIGKQWMWHLQHANGVRENNALHVPRGVPIKLTMISQDVMHAFFVPAFRIQKAVLPGRYTAIWFTPTQTGRFHLFCNEYCGANHSEMTGYVTVMEPADFQVWLDSGGSIPAEKGRASVKSMAAAGADLYEQYKCGTCHDADMENRGPLLAGLYGSRVTLKNGQTAIADDAYLRESLLNPSDKLAAKYQQVMPSYKDTLNEDQILQLIAYMKSLSAAPPAGTPGRAPAPSPSRSAGAATAAGTQNERSSNR